MKIINRVTKLKIIIEKDLKDLILVKSLVSPVKVLKNPTNWIILGTGNYAAVFYHENYPEFAIKVYREKNTQYKNKKEGIKEEIAVYKKLNSLNKHYFAKLHNYGKNYIIIDRIEGITLYEYLKKGIYISPDIIKEVDIAISQLKNINLSSHDIHFKNILVTKKEVIIIDVSDFLNFDYCPLWNDSKKFYNFYQKIPIFPIPEIILNISKFLYKFIYYLSKLFKFKKPNSC